MPVPQQIHFVLNTSTNEVQIFATRFLPVTNNTGCRLKWWRINVSLEQIDTATTRQWSYSATGQRDELQHHLGPGFKVLQQWEALNYLKAATMAEQAVKELEPIKTFVVTQRTGSEDNNENSEVIYCGTDEAEARKIAGNISFTGPGSMCHELEVWQNGKCVKDEDFNPGQK